MHWTITILIEFLFSSSEMMTSGGTFSSGGFFSNILNKISHAQSQNEEPKTFFCENFEPTLMRIVCVPEQVGKSGANHNFCAFIVSDENDGLVGFVIMTKIFRQNDTASDGHFPAVKVHFVRRLIAGKAYPL